MIRRAIMVIIFICALFWFFSAACNIAEVGGTRSSIYKSPKKNVIDEREKRKVIAEFLNKSHSQFVNDIEEAIANESP